jgi:hypothetical protein
MHRRATSYSPPRRAAACRAGAALAGMFATFAWLGAQTSCLARQGEVSADSSSNPYLVIVDKNVFHLNPVPAPEEPEKPAPPALPVIRLSGFMQTGNQVKVLLAVEVRGPDTKTGIETNYMALAEGDKKSLGPDGNHAVVEMVKADADRETAEIINCGNPVTLTMKANGFEKLAEAQAAGRAQVAERKDRIAQVVAARQAAAANLAQNPDSTRRLIMR